MSSVYRAIMRHALKVAWQTKYLWFFGLFAVILETDRVINLVTDKYPRLVEMGSFLETARLFFKRGTPPDFFANLKELFTGFTGGNTLTFIIIIILGLFLLWLSVVSQSALFSAIYRQFKKQKSGFSQMVKFGQSKFWPVLWLNILARLAIFVPWLVIGLPFFLLYINQGTAWSENVFVIISFLVSIIFSIIIYFLFRYAILFLIKDGRGVGTALKESWILFKENWMASLEMAVLMFLADVLTTIVLVLGLAIITVPLFLLYTFLASSGLLASSGTLLIVLYILAVLWILFVVAFSSVFRHAAWTILFSRMTEGEVLPKIVRLLGSSMVKKQ